MLQIAVLLRTSFLLKHNCHNMVARMIFFSDHEFLGSSYQEALDQYDSVIERLIGLGQTPDLVMVQAQAVEGLKAIPLSYKENSECFSAILGLNKRILSNIEIECKSGKLTQGTIQLLGDIADKIEIENYKIGQRLKK
jgi:DNA-binding ferritin-like protein